MATAIADSEKGVVVLNEIERDREPKPKYNTGLAALQIGKNKQRWLYAITARCTWLL
jgi:hypothetical protein